MSKILNFIASAGSEIPGSKDVRGMLGSGPPQAFDVEYTAPGDKPRLMSSIHENGNPGAFSTPSEFRGELHPFQLRGAAWLAMMYRLGLGALLADEMGLGKTIQTLALLGAREQADDGNGLPSLIVCPVSVLENWRREAQKFVPGLKVAIFHGPDRAGSPLEAADSVLTSYSTLWRNPVQLSGPWNTIVLDEAQNVKNHLTKAAKVIRQIRCRFRLALTGTPLENHVGELWSIHNWLNPWLLGSRESQKTVCRTNQEIRLGGHRQAAEPDPAIHAAQAES